MLFSLPPPPPQILSRFERARAAAPAIDADESSRAPSLFSLCTLDELAPCCSTVFTFAGLQLTADNATSNIRERRSAVTIYVRVTFQSINVIILSQKYTMSIFSRIDRKRVHLTIVINPLKDNIYHLKVISVINFVTGKYCDVMFANHR